MKKVLWVSDSPLTNTGYAKVTHEICKRIGKSYEVHVLGQGHLGKSLSIENYFLHSFEDINSLNRAVNILKPDFIVWLADLVTMRGILNIDLGNSKFIPYFPVDSEQLLFGSKQILEKAYKRVAISKFARDVAKKDGFDSETIYHGVDTNVYKSVQINKTKFGIEDNKFVFLSIAKNIGRKLLCRLIYCFNEFAKDKDDVILILRTNPNEKDLNLAEFTNYRFPDLFLKKKLFFSESPIFEPVTEEFMNEFYNVCDVYIATTYGEGFGLPYVEAMACKKPVIAPNFSTTQELILDKIEDIEPRGIGTRIATHVTDMRYYADHGLCDIEDTVNAMNKIYNNKALREKMGENGLKFVKRFCDWDKIADQWIKILGS